MEIPTILKEGSTMHVMTLFNPQSPRKDQNQFSPNNIIHTSSKEKVTRINKIVAKGKCFDLLSHALTQYFKKMHAWRSGQICMQIWELFCFVNHRAVTRYRPGNDILYSKGNKATRKKPRMQWCTVQSCWSNPSALMCFYQKKLQYYINCHSK